MTFGIPSPMPSVSIATIPRYILNTYDAAERGERIVTTAGRMVTRVIDTPQEEEYPDLKGASKLIIVFREKQK